MWMWTHEAVSTTAALAAIIIVCLHCCCCGHGNNWGGSCACVRNLLWVVRNAALSYMNELARCRCSFFMLWTLLAPFGIIYRSLYFEINFYHICFVLLYWLQNTAKSTFSSTHFHFAALITSCYIIFSDCSMLQSCLSTSLRHIWNACNVYQICGCVCV